MTELANPAATGGLDFGSILDKTLSAYQSISVARIDRDTARYNAAGAAQFAALHNSQSPTMLDAWNGSNQAVSSLPRTAVNAPSGIPTGVIFIGLGLVGAVLAWKALK
jgi:hypothetical protein